MAGPLTVFKRWIARIICFLGSEGEKKYSSQNEKAVLGHVCITMANICVAQDIGESSLTDAPCFCQFHYANVPETEVEWIIWENQRITINDVAEEFKISQGTSFTTCGSTRKSLLVEYQLAPDLKEHCKPLWGCFWNSFNDFIMP